MLHVFPFKFSFGGISDGVYILPGFHRMGCQSCVNIQLHEIISSMHFVTEKNTEKDSQYGCFLKWCYPQNIPKWSFVVGKPIVAGETHHSRKPPYEI